MESPAKRRRLSIHRNSLSGRRSTNSHAGTSRITNQQPMYDIITGEPIDFVGPQSAAQSHSNNQALRQSTSRQSMLPKPERPPAIVSQQKYEEETLGLQSRIKSLEYELKEQRDSAELVALLHEKELQKAQSRANEDYQKYQEAEGQRLKATRQCEEAFKATRQTREDGITEKASLDRRLRELQVRNDTLCEEKEEMQDKLNDVEREMRRVLVDEVEGKRSTLERTLEETRLELEDLHIRFSTVNVKLQQKEQDIELLENKVMELNGQVGGGEELEVLKRELSDQLAYIRRLETQNHEQTSELRRLRDERRSVNVVEEQRRALEVQVKVLQDTERKLGELEIQKEILEDEKRMWTSLLERDEEEGPREFESPEAVVKALVNERIQHALAVQRLGDVESELAGKDETTRAQDAAIQNLKDEVAKSKASATPIADGGADQKAYKRLERQRQLGLKEIEYLRAQLKTFDAEETTLMDNHNFDAQRAEQLQKLQDLVDQYKSEMQTLHSDLSKMESSLQSQQALSTEPGGTNRPADSAHLEDEASAQIGPLLRKNKNLQVALQKTTQQSQLLATELQATKSQLKALRNSAQTRVLELRDNPTAQFEAIKLSTLKVLKQENTELMTQLRGEDSQRTKVVPVSSLDALKLDLKAMEDNIAEKDKRMRRQREIWTEKAAEFRDVVASILGYKVTFMPNGKVKVSSMYFGDEERRQEAEDDTEDYIMFDGEKGTMKIGGGNDGPFGLDVKELVDFWVKERQEIPCFLAAMTLEFYEKYGGMNPGTVA